MEYPRTKAGKRSQRSDVLRDLYALKESGTCTNEYALNANIEFFESLYSFPKFLKWYFRVRPKLDGSHLLELSDFGLANGKWERILQRDLLEIEQWKFPDLLKELRTTILSELGKLEGRKQNVLLVNLGAGAMEIDRQVIKRLQATGTHPNTIFIGIDSSESSLKAAEQNLRSLKTAVSVVRIDELHPTVVATEVRKTEGIRVLLYKGNALDLHKYFAPESVDVLYFSKFKHHLTEAQKNVLDARIARTAHVGIEFDNLRGWFMQVIPIKSQWNQPVLLNGALFSCLRNMSKREVEGFAMNNTEITTTVDSYVRIVRQPHGRIGRIIDAGMQAPSGENTQPWRFSVKGNSIELYDMPECDQSLYNWEQRATYVAHGACIENMQIAAQSLGFATTIQLSQKNDRNHVATLSLTESDVPVHPLYTALGTRVTNRKKYSTKPVNLREIEDITEANVSVAVTNETTVIQRLASLVSVGEQILFENKGLHTFFFSHVTWNNKEDQRVRRGMYVKTLELPPPAQIGFKIFKNWSRLSRLNRGGAVSKKVKEENEKNYRASGAFGAICIKDDSPESYIRAGMVLERVWLIATHHKLALQPVTGLCFFALRVRGGAGSIFSKEHQEMITDAYSQVVQTLSGEGTKDIALLFRMGYTDSGPSARSLRVNATVS